MMLPAAWAALLKIQDFAARKTLPSRAHGDVSVDDPRPYRDDSREVTARVGPYLVTAQLMSGDGNYWLDWEIRHAKTKAILFGMGNGDVDFDISPVQAMTLTTRRTLAFDVETVSVYDWERVPLYKVQRAALQDSRAAMEAARRYAVAHTKSWQTDAYRTRLAGAFYTGLAGGAAAPRPIRGGNFSTPARRAYHAGRTLRLEITTAAPAV